MSHVKDVRPSSEPGRYRWLLSGPGGTTFHWEVRVTRLVKDRLIAWETLPGSAVKSDGRVRFRPVGSGTEIDIQLSYSPPAGRLGHALARLVRADPKRQLDRDLLRLETLLERERSSATEAGAAQRPPPAAEQPPLLH